jgi:hypothetical protein
MQVTIDIKPGTIKRMLFAAVTLAALGTAVVAYAVPVTFKDGDVLKAQQLNDNFADLEKRVAAIEAGNPDCPAGYTATGPAASFLPATMVCQKTNANKQVVDEVVKIGTGAEAFWIDR